MYFLVAMTIDCKIQTFTDELPNPREQYSV